ncbi:Hypothetical protein POVR2_LOCUS207 [uncultured virus]|nr:Hypothetical protein POVR2_LOCUS207 [uncultured virus]
MNPASRRARIDPTALSTAAEYGDILRLQSLLAAGRIDPNDTSLRHKYPPLTLAADNGRVEAVRLLLADARVDPNNNEGDTTALIQACYASLDGLRDEYVEIVELLLASGADPDAYDNRPLIAASEFADNYRIVDLLLFYHADPNGDYGEPLLRAAQHERVGIVSSLLSDDATNAAAGENAALWQAIETGNLDILEMLLGNDDVLASLTQTDLDHAIETDDELVIDMVRDALDGI